MSVECVSQLGFHRPLTSRVKEPLIMRNPNSSPVAFKIKTTAPKQYCVRPNSGRIEAGQEVEVQVLWQAMEEEPPKDIKCRDKFLVQSTMISAEHESSSISELWTAVESKNKNDIHEKKIRCVFLPHDGSSATQNSTHDTHEESTALPAYHAAEYSSPDAQYNETFDKSVETRDFKPEPALSKASSSVAGVAGNALQSKLDDANLKIEKLQQQLNTAGSRSKVTNIKTPNHNEGVPVPLVALIALIAFLAAYLLF